MRSEPIVSVLVAAYKAHDYLRQALASALAQTEPRLEILVADDANDREAERVAASFGDARIVYHGNPGRLGPARNHWTALGRARARYAAILNHDDLWRPTFVE